ncbi:septal ring lytic transglycosylase RlpA family protein [Piscinibacter sp.]|uniref:septal ring lytic transglycosylase RlpA family protein n=1 Tax=Piscinibacter sp. TaxID=1903157 RepID=UPI00258BB748|nr:septal ring lytic transglycosylase RlpA family protein [Piscinibacter sp.]
MPMPPRRLPAAAALLAALLLAGCGALKPPSGRPGTVAAPATPHDLPAAVGRVEPPGPGVAALPGAEPRVPEAAAPAPAETGIASWYGRAFHGRRTANGERFDMRAMTAAHPRLPFHSLVRVRNPANGREVVVRINDRGPFKRGRIVDLSWAAAQRLGIQGLATVELWPLAVGGAEAAADQAR